MSQETMSDLRKNLVGCDYRPWWASQDDWDNRANDPDSVFYPSFIPSEDVAKRLFTFNMESVPVFMMDRDGGFIEIPGRAALRRDDNHFVTGIFTDGYQTAGHQYREWCLDLCAQVASADLGIQTAGLLKQGSQAWVSFSVKDTTTTPEGVEFRPNLLFTTGFDGSPSVAKRVVTLVVCDNTRNAALSEQGQTYRVKHTKHSTAKIHDAREALGIVFNSSDDFAAEVKALCEVTVTDKEWDKFLHSLVPMKADSALSVTVAGNKRDKLTALYRNDPRCAPWTNTAFGVLQAVNTYNLHETQVRKGNSRIEKIMENTISGAIDKEDNDAAKRLAAILRRKSLIAA